LKPTADQTKTASSAAEGQRDLASPPVLSLPKGGGALHGIGEKFAANPVTGTGSTSVPLATTPGRGGFGPQLTLSYDSGSGNGAFGLGWSLGLPGVTRKTDKGLPQYRDDDESDVFVLSGAEDLVPLLSMSGSGWERVSTERAVGGTSYRVYPYRPRVEGLFARVERWLNLETGESHWRSISHDNITTLYGSDVESRIADPADRNRIFHWNICKSFDDKGNAIVYRYAAENSAGVDRSLAHEANRTDIVRSANRYLKTILYGNRTSRLMQGDLAESDWMFEVIFDYGEHDPDNPTPHDANPWICRNDPFSSYRAGFETRTYRLCQRVLMFHHFPNEAGVGQDCLVRSTDFAYRNSRNSPEDLQKGNPLASFIASISHSGYKRQASAGYVRKSMPPLEFRYTEAVIDENIHELPEESLENLPIGVDGAGYRWADLDGDGLSGILAEQGGQWFYKPNLGDGRFGAAECVPMRPSFAALNSSRQQLTDITGDGQLDLVDYSGANPGYFKRTSDGDWEPFASFSSLPEIAWEDPNLRFLDLDGDGHADVLITEAEVFTWYRSLAEEGFSSALRVAKPFDEEKGPRLVFADGTQSIYLADMSGDGLTDLVRIGNGEVCYWPNRGFGNFGSKVTMDRAPWMDFPDRFDQQRVRLADVDGSGTTDMIYLAVDAARIYFNYSGNQWSDPFPLNQFPVPDNIASVSTADLLGNGTACLVWSTPLPFAVRGPLRYIDLMGGQKPHLLVSVTNNLGAETRVTYAASTKFYLEDMARGEPWITRLPFPVHVVERVEIYDRIGRNRFVTRYAYHHGFFDGVEREFRGFGRVDQWDTEELGSLRNGKSFPVGDNFDARSDLPPLLTRTWFHTGAYAQEGRISTQFEREYYREGDEVEGLVGLTDSQLAAMRIPDTVLPLTVRTASGVALPWHLTGDELREACRALKGSILRQEVYGADGTEAADRPYSVSERNYTVECLQPREGNKHAVFFSHSRETVDFHYERKLYQVRNGTIADPSLPAANGVAAKCDPRVSHAITLEVDAFGNVLKSIAIGYGRRFDDLDPTLTADDRRKQKQILQTYTEIEVTNPVLLEDAYQTPLPSKSSTYELVNLKPDSAQPEITNLYAFEELQRKIAVLTEGSDHNARTVGDRSAQPWKRFIERSCSLYRKDDLSGPLVLGKLESMALPFQTYKLAFTTAHLSKVFERTPANQPAVSLLPQPGEVLHKEGGYVDLNNDGDWWIPSGRVFHSPGASDEPAQELTYARQHFFSPCRFQDPFLQVATAAYDKYDLLLLETSDAAGNRVTAGERDAAGKISMSSNDYRVLHPALVMDSNRNRSALAFDTLGMVVGTAVMGKPEEKLGDTLAGFVADLDEPVLAAHLQSPLVNPQEILQGATTRLVYDLFAYMRTAADPRPQPGAVYTLARETHVADLTGSQQSKVQHSFSYSDGFGREIQKKAQAEPGPLGDGGPGVAPRWIGSGWTIFNNKGKPVRQYEPFFTATHRFEFANKVGVSPILFYDPAERVVATLHPNHVYEKVVFDPWRQASWDGNDTVAPADPSADVDVGGYFQRLPAGDYLPTWFAQRSTGGLGAQEQSAALKAAVHANTPTVAHFDSLGRPMLTVAHNRSVRNGVASEEKYGTRTDLDVQGNQLAVTDALNRVIMTYDYDMVKNRLHQSSVDAGDRWMLNDVAQKPIRAWNDRGFQTRFAYDALRRPIQSFVQPAGAAEFLAEWSVYGESLAAPEALNLRGRIYRHFDAAGVATNTAFDFKGNLLASTRQLAIEYRQPVDWSSLAAVKDAGQTAKAAAAWLQAEIFTSSSTFDALNRVIAATEPDRSVARPVFNEANLLEQMGVTLASAKSATLFVTNIDYNAKGQRTLVEYGNGARTGYSYNPETFRLTQLKTSRASDKAVLQDLSYSYDPVGNITSIGDAAQQTIYFKNQVVTANAGYTYDAVYRLISASGREHIGQLSQPQTGWEDVPRIDQPLPTDGQAMRNYVENYAYDAVGNILHVVHEAANANWTRTYAYDEPFASAANNRLTSTTVGSMKEPYSYDAHGNMTQMPHLPRMTWDYKDQLASAQRQVVNDGPGETTYYVYDSSGQRVRKVTQSGGGTKTKERIYFGGYEVYREFGSGGKSVTLERQTLHVMDDKRRVALVETNATSDAAPVLRYQFDNHLGSASLELDSASAIISYEEYYPYGSTSYETVASGIPVSTKRYRYTGKERDEETALYYHGARYYVPWLGRWCACDPASTAEQSNLYTYGRNNPPRYNDLNGLWEVDMHFTAVYLAGRLQGATPAEAMHAALASQAMDDYRNLGAPGPKLRALETSGIANYPETERHLDEAGIPKQEFTAPSPIPRQVAPPGSVLVNPGDVLEDAHLENRLANNAHALGVTRSQSQEVARLGVASNNLTLFGLGLHTVGDFLPHANTTGYPTPGHQFGKNENQTSSDPSSHSADKTAANPRKALATFMDFMELWSNMLSTPTRTLSQPQLDQLNSFLTSSSNVTKNAAAENLLRSAGASDDEIKKVLGFANNPDMRRAAFEADMATPEGQEALRQAVGSWLSRPNDSTFLRLKTDVTPYTDDPRLPDIAHVSYTTPHKLSAGGHRNPF
jgi:RHS repeat-associated protein